jgi:hypothetical protein
MTDIKTRIRDHLVKDLLMGRPYSINNNYFPEVTKVTNVTREILFDIYAELKETANIDPKTDLF